MSSAPANAPNPLLVLLDFVASPLLLFNAEGGVVYTNQAAKAMRCRPSLLLGSDPNVRALAKDIAAGRVLASTELRIEAMSDDGIARLVCRSAPKPIAGLVAMAVSVAEIEQPEGSEVAPEPAQQRMSVQQIMELLKAELLPPIQHVLDQPANPSGLSTSVGQLRERLERVVDLVNVFGEDVLIGEERMIVPDLVRDICQELNPMAKAKGVSFVIEGERDDLPPVYGSRRLMRRALRECLHNALDNAREGVRTNETVAVGVNFRGSGQHLLVNIHNIGTLSAAALSRHAAAIFRPTPQGATTDTDAQEKMHIGLPLTQRILQLHGGQLRIEQDSSQELDVMLELPTGAPLRSTQHLDMLQAQIYAEDLSKLMARTRKRSTA
ncbi:sensor histidine kinase [Hydrogenophaga sp. RWCD_12]|uniref:sensor histidine kinase n=1 Tax=Hydrogenophaga sp. RWCD_12 TaxID=3391190 RepID=UPI003985057E